MSGLTTEILNSLDVDNAFYRMPNDCRISRAGKREVMYIAAVILFGSATDKAYVSLSGLGYLYGYMKSNHVLKSWHCAREIKRVVKLWGKQAVIDALRQE